MADLTPITRKEKILSGEDITPVTRLEYFMKNAGGGSGAGLPSYTASDIGKSLTVVQGTETVTVVPEQTVTTNQEVILDNGTTILHNAAEITGIEFTLENGPDILNAVGSITGVDDTTSMTLEKTTRGYRLTGDYPLQVMYYEADTGKWYLAWQTSAEITISATASIPSAPSVGWEKSGGNKPVEVFVDESNAPTEINMNAAELYSILRNGSVRFEYTMNGMGGVYGVLQLYVFGEYEGAYQFILVMDDYSGADPVKYEFTAMSGNEHPVLEGAR